MNKYPYSYEEFLRETKKQYLKDYCNNNISYMNKMFKTEDLDSVVKGNYNSSKSSYESGERELLKNITLEVRGTVACLGNF